MKFQKKEAVTGLLFAISLIGMTYQSTSIAGHADKNKRGVQGSVTCGGNYFSRSGGSELHRSTYVLRNIANEGAINIQRIRVYNANGMVLFDSSLTGLPSFYNSVVSASDTALDPHQSAQLRIVDMIPSQSRNNRPLQTVINWTANQTILSLEAVNVRTIADVDPVTGKVGKQRGRHLYECRTTKLTKHW